MGVKLGEIAHVIITHAHFDHFNGVTQELEGTHVPCFPNARHYLGSADWESADMRTALQDTRSLESHTVGILRQKRLLELVKGNFSVESEVEIIAAPGETPGHQIVRVCSEGQTLYCLGDLYHDPIEVEHPEWMVSWANADANRISRRALTDAALAENALLVATHIPTIGHLERAASGVAWSSM
jgi:glyoxylase-like metal-dependent hydrolase (beta-lactamase superfamily II)